MTATVDLEPRTLDFTGEASLVQRCSQPDGWTSAAPNRIRKAADPAQFVRWVAETGRKNPLSAHGGGAAIAWGVATVDGPSPACELLALAAKHAVETSAASLKGKQRTRIADAVQQWRSWAKEGDPSDLPFALASLAVAHLAPVAASCCEDDPWWDALDALCRLAAREPQAGGDAEGMLAAQLLGTELALTLATLFPEIEGCAKLARVAADRLSASADDLLNGEGLPHGDVIGGLLPLTACWTRLAILAAAAKKSPWSKFAKSQYGWLVRQTVRWTGSDGRALLAEPFSDRWTPEFLQAALHYGGDASDASAAEELLGRKPLGKFAGAAKTHEPPEPSDRCEWSGVAVLRTDWSSRRVALAINFSQPELQLELRVGKQVIFRGPWSTDLSMAGSRVEPSDDWEETCWFTDDDVDFLELTLPLANGMQVERQFLLARQEMFLFVADYCTGAPRGPRELTYSASLPLVDGVEFAGERETRDGLLVAGDAAWRVLPLGLAEWRSEPRGGELAAVDGRLAWSASRSGVSITSPLLIDLQSKRSRKQCTWRQLTIAEALEIQTPDAAVGYRAQSGKDQWLFYRSLAERANRTLLGQNTASEFFAAVFDPDAGSVEELVEIEG